MDKKLLFSTDIILLDKNADINKGCVVAVGGFDGVHLGHRLLLDALREESCRLGLPSAVFTFDPFDSPKTGSKLLATPEQKNHLFAESGVSAVFSASFSKLRNVPAMDFVNNFIFLGMGAKSVVCGYDFRFGFGREGDVEMIRDLLSPKGVSVVSPPAFLREGVPVSATAVRACISEGKISEANEMLGRKFSFSAEISHGAKLGRTLGFPTVNQKYPEFLITPRFGVYAVECVLGDKVYGGVANFGIKPTVGGVSAPLCETHIFGFQGDCYGEIAEIRFVEFIREEMRFPSVEELGKQVEKDKDIAKGILSKGVYCQ